MKILTIDDDDKFNNLLAHQLRKSNYEVTTTTNAKCFIDNLKEKKFDLCLIDLNLTEGENSGLQLLKLIRDKFKDELAVIILSRLDNQSDITHAIECGANDYVTKPLDIDILNTKIRRIFDEQSHYKKILKASSVPRDLQQCSINSSFTILKVLENGLAIKGNNCLSKGTKIELKETHVNKALNISNIPLIVTKNLRQEDGSYFMLLELRDKDFELSDYFKEWILDKIEKSA